jgi:hypothetical protein
MFLKKFAALLMTATALGGCSALSEGRWGPSPVPLASAVEASVAREMAVVRAISQGTFDVMPAFGDRRGWYNVILTGFNVVDDACISYIDDLWIIERRKERNATLISAVGAAVAGIISAGANPSASTLGVLAQAFNLATAFNSAIADSYLYTQNAATIKKLIRTTTSAYRDDLAGHIGGNEVAYPMGSPTAAYFHMREYLALCLPPSIQAQIEDLVTGAMAGPGAVNAVQERAVVTGVMGTKGIPTTAAVEAVQVRSVLRPRTTPRIRVF